MGADKTDISQIRKYLNGELDAHAMHQLERRAQDDPFLMDALDGYTANKHDQHANLNELQSKLNQRAAQGQRKALTLWPLVSIAATVLVFISVGAWWVLIYQPKTTKMDTAVIRADKTVVAKKSIDTQGIYRPPIMPPSLPQHHEIVKPAGAANRTAVAINQTESRVKKADGAVINVPTANSATNQAALAIAPVVQADPNASAYQNTTTKTDTAAQLAEVTIPGYPLQTKGNALGAAGTLNPINQTLKSRVEDVRVNIPELKTRARIVNGQVVSGDDNLPIPGASVRVAGRNIGALTDANGKFKIEATEKDKVTVGFLGYESKAVDVQGDSLSVALQPASGALNEVVIGYGTKKDVEKAHPVTGWDKFQQYLEKNATLPNSEKGTVHLQFVVNADNSLSNFTVIKSLSQQADAETIRLVKAGPAWVHQATGQPDTVLVKISFK